MHSKSTSPSFVSLALLVLVSVGLSAVAESPYTDILVANFVGAAQRGSVEDISLVKFGLEAPTPDSDGAEQYVHRAALFQLNTKESTTAMMVCAERVYLVPKNGSATASTGLLTSQNPVDVLDRAGGKLVFATAMLATQVMVQFKPGIDVRNGSAWLPSGLKLSQQLAERLYLVSFDPKTPTELYRTLNSLRAMEDAVEFAEPDYLGVSMSTTPNDADYSLQWNLPRINMPLAWDLSTGGSAVVAIMDTGIKTTQPDLAANIWLNPSTLTNGWNFVDNNSNVTDTVGHGTHVAGIAGAVGNNSIGVAGVAWNVKLMPLKITTTTGSGTTAVYSAAVLACTYIRSVYNSLGIRTVATNHSWGGTSYSQGLYNAINNSFATTDPLPPANAITATWSSGSRVLALSGSSADIALILPAMTVYKNPEIATSIGTAPVVLLKYTELGVTYITLSALPHNASGTNVPLTFSNPTASDGYGTVHVTAAGSSGMNTDLTPVFPACFPCDLLVNVGGSTSDAGTSEKPTTDSNFGKYSVNLFAPGQTIWSTNLSPAYQQLSGSSYAAPHLTGAIALFALTHPTCDEYNTRRLILQSAFDQPPLFNLKCTTNGRLNVKSLLDAVYP